jgi:hypothetical protein
LLKGDTASTLELQSVSKDANSDVVETLEEQQADKEDLPRCNVECILDSEGSDEDKVDQ